MSNKSLLISIFGVVVVFAAVFAVLRLKKEPMVAVEKNQANNLSEKTMDTSKPEEKQPVENVLGIVENNSGDTASCQRNFSPETLKSAKVNVENRKVEIQVKDFGKIVVSFYEKDSPKTVENFLRLANAGYFNCLTFHRVAKGFVIQGL